MSSGSRPNVDARLLAAVESSPSGLLMIDAGGRIVLVNREIERLFGYSRDELLGQSVDLLVPESLRAGHAASRARYLEAPAMRAMGAGNRAPGLIRPHWTRNFFTSGMGTSRHSPGSIARQGHSGKNARAAACID